MPHRKCPHCLLPSSTARPPLLDAGAQMAGLFLPSPGGQTSGIEVWAGWFGGVSPWPRFPEPLHLSSFCPRDHGRKVDSPALPRRGSDLHGAPQDEASLTKKFET